MNASDSWWLKFSRAQRQMEDIATYVSAYGQADVYRPERVRQPKGKRHWWVYVLRMTHQPHPELAVMLGEFLFNLRSALDHVVVACAPANRKSKAFFPIEDRAIWDTNEAGQFLNANDAERRKSFESATRGLPTAVQAIIEAAQPYNSPGDPPRDHLAVLARLHNADKHRNLVTFALGVRDSYIRVTGPSDPGDPVTVSVGSRREHFVEDNAELIATGFGDDARDDPPESEVQVDLTATAVVAVKVGGENWNFELPVDLLGMLSRTGLVLASLNPFTGVSHGTPPLQYWQPDSPQPEA